MAGEASGDLLGAGLITALRERFPCAQFAGIGGPRMIEAGLDSWYSIEKLAVMGVFEVLKHLPELLAIRRDTLRRTLAWQPDVFIGIDAPDFNLNLERRLKASAIRIVHYVSPSVWAWRTKRTKTIGLSANCVLCLFPMEPAIYAEYGIDARFVGHPLADKFALEPNQAIARRALNLPLDATVLAVLPGSRLGEITRLGSDFLKAVARLQRELPNLYVIAPMANATCRNAFETLMRKTIDDGLRRCNPHPSSDAPFSSANFRIIDGRAHEAMIASDAVLLASGTAALEACLAKRPMVVAYRLASLTYRLITHLGLMKVKHYSLPNILADRSLVPELMQDACTPDALAALLLPYLKNRQIPGELLSEYRRLHLLLRYDADQTAANAIAEWIPKPALPPE